MTTLLVSPRIDSFSVKVGNNVIRTKLDGGAARYRLDKIGDTHEVHASWILDAEAYNYLMAFYRTEIDFGSLPFQCYMKSVDAAAKTLYTVRIIPDSFSVKYLGGVYEVEASLEVTPLTHNESADQALITAGP